MSRTAKVAVLLIAVLASGVALAATSAAILTYRAGTMQVSVHEKTAGGVSFSLRMPMILVGGAMRLIPSEQLQVARRSAGPFVPMICRAADALAEAPDGPLVEVESAEETVRVAIESGDLTISVDSPSEAVTVSIPVRAVARIARFLGGGADASTRPLEAGCNDLRPLEQAAGSRI
jgi:hypothetical protein